MWSYIMIVSTTSEQAPQTVNNVMVLHMRWQVFLWYTSCSQFLLRYVAQDRPYLCITVQVMEYHLEFIDHCFSWLRKIGKWHLKINRLCYTRLSQNDLPVCYHCSINWQCLWRLELVNEPNTSHQWENIVNNFTKIEYWNFDINSNNVWNGTIGLKIILFWWYSQDRYSNWPNSTSPNKKNFAEQYIGFRFKISYQFWNSNTCQPYWRPIEHSFTLPVI